MLCTGNVFIRVSRKYFRSLAREFTPESHKNKDNTPTMGGILIILVVTITTLLWADLTDIKIWILLGTLGCFGAIGAWDDWRKIKYNRGISEAKKFLAQLCVASVIVLVWYYMVTPSTLLVVPLFKNLMWNLGWLLVPWAIWVILCTVNAVNFTDGLDGLAATSLLFNFLTFALIAYLVGHQFFASYLHVPFAGTAEVSIVACSLIGSLLGFLWYNTYPAQIFMGDVGSLSLGAVFAMIALMTKQECLIPLSGGLFVIEGVSVALQIVVYKLFKRRIFRMAPIHHHFELLGWQESKITVRFAILTFVFCIFALITLKIR